MRYELDIKPLTVNQAWQGKRFKTTNYKSFERAILLMLPSKINIPDGELTLILDWGFSNYSCSDWDNPIKPFQDCLQKKYGFNDSRIKRGIVTKHKVKKGSELIRFRFEMYQD